MNNGNKERYSYPVVFRFDEDGISIEFPDLPGCYSAADTAKEAFINAEEALGLHLWGLEEDGDDIPMATRVEKIKKDEDSDMISLITVYMPPIRDSINR